MARSAISRKSGSDRSTSPCSCSLASGPLGCAPGPKRICLRHQDSYWPDTVYSFDSLGIMVKPTLRHWSFVGVALGIAKLAAGADLIVHAGMLIDGVTATPRSHMSIIIHDERITGIEAGFVTRDGATIIDLSQETVMPGLIDCHVHIATKLPSRMNATEYELTHSDIDRAFDGAQFARELLQQGFTSARDVGWRLYRNAARCPMPESSGPAPLGLARAARTHCRARRQPLGAGSIPLASGLGRWPGPQPGSGRLRVREHKRRGADLIKIMPSGRHRLHRHNPRLQPMTDEEPTGYCRHGACTGSEIGADYPGRND